MSLRYCRVYIIISWSQEALKPCRSLRSSAQSRKLRSHPQTYISISSLLLIIRSIRIISIAILNPKP